MPQKSPGTLFNKHVNPDPAGTIDDSDRKIDARGKMCRDFPSCCAHPPGYQSRGTDSGKQDNPKQGRVAER